MSTVTNIMISDDSISYLDGDTRIINELNLVRIDRQSVGGNKAFEDDLYLGAFNRLDLEKYITKVKEVCQHKLWDIQLFVKEQDDEKWREIKLMEG